jgi:DNA-binding beta-propeller fold protein YncE
MYFTEAIFGFGRVSRTDLDGANRETFLNNQVNPQDIAVDPAGGKMYWSSLDGKIQRANLDGTSVETFATIALYPAGLFVDGVNRKLYWSLSSPGSIHRANLDGTGIETLPLNVGLDPGDLAFDATTNKVYWTERGGHKIVRGNIDGTSQEDLVLLDMDYFPDGLDLDLAAGKVYWSAGGWFSDRIQRANLDGSAVETVYEDLNEIYPYPGSTVFRHIALSFVPEPSGLHIVAAAMIAGPLAARKRRGPAR